MSTDSYAISSARESQDAEMGETMVLEGPIKYKSWVWEHFTCVRPKVSRTSIPLQSDCSRWASALLYVDFILTALWAVACEDRSPTVGRTDGRGLECLIFKRSRSGRV